MGIPQACLHARERLLKRLQPRRTTNGTNVIDPTKPCRMNLEPPPLPHKQAFVIALHPPPPFHPSLLLPHTHNPNSTSTSTSTRCASVPIYIPISFHIILTQTLPTSCHPYTSTQHKTYETPPSPFAISNHHLPTKASEQKLGI
jgi:hypothetical protein